MPLNVNYKLLFCSLLLFQALPSDAETFFTDVTAELGVPLFDSRSLAIGDFDNDGWPDLFAAENRIIGRVSLLRNEGDGSFSSHNARIRTHIPDSHKGGGSIFGDIDNDGDQDLFMAIGSDDKDEGDRNLLLRNDRGVFVAAQAGLLDSLSTDSAIWMDYDRDGFIDLYTANPLERNILYRNNGDGSFTDQTAAAGLDLRFHPENGGSTDGLVAADFDNDGWSDLYIGNFLAPNRLFLNNRQGGFRDATTDEIGDEGEAFGVAVGDIDNDGDLDIFQASGGGSVEVPFRSIMLLNLGAGEFLDVTENLGLGVLREINAANPGLADIDNDGDLDLVIAHSERRLFLNDGSGRFEEATEVSGIVPKRRRAGYLSFGDYNLDGFVDIWTENGLSRNNGNSNHFLRVELVGVESNRNAIGARVWATSGDLAQMREILGGVGRQQDEKVAHFGLAQHTRVDRLEIRWPSGQVDVLENIPADQKIRVFEGREGYHVARAAAWESAPPAVVVEDATASFEIRVRPSLFEPDAEITRVSAELIAFGGEDLSLEAFRDGTYGLNATLRVNSPRGPRNVSIAIEQSTSLGPRWTRLARPVTVAPAIDLPIFAGLGDESWKVSSLWLNNLTKDPNLDLFPAWSPDGAKVLFSSFRDAMDVYQVQADGSDLVRLTNPSVWDWIPVFSPDGSKIAFTSHRDDNGEIYVMDADGSNEVRLTDSEAYDEAGGWSSEGKIVFNTSRDGNDEIYVMNADGSNPVNLTNHPGRDNHAAWSPDGTKVIFNSTRDGNNEIYVMDADGSNQINLTRHPALDVDGNFSPDGSRIAFSSNRDGDTDIYLMNADGSNPVNLTSYPHSDQTSDWSPDGRHLVFARSKPGPGIRGPDIFVMEVEASDRLVVQPNQQRVVYQGHSAVQVSAEDGEWQVLYEPAEPIGLAGYAVLSFAFHPGDTRAPPGAFFWIGLDESTDPQFMATITRSENSNSEIDLLGVTRPDAKIDLGVRDWQVVEVPLSLLRGAQRDVDAINFNGNLHGTFYLDDVRLITAANVRRATAVEEEETASLPGAFALDQNYPNPFNSGTVIRFELPTAGQTELAVYNVVGQKVASLVDGTREAGRYTVRWKGRDNRGQTLGSGVYFYRLRVNKHVETRKLLLLR